MKRPRVRLTTGGLMIVVAASALALGVEGSRQRHLVLADACWRMARLDSDRASWLAKVLKKDEAPEVARLQRRADRWGALMEEHRRVARYPWLSVGPGSTEPERSP